MPILFISLYVASPFLLLRANRKWGVPAAILTLWIPIELGLFRWFGVPSWSAMLAGMVAGVLAFAARPDVMNVSKAFDIRRLSLRQAVVNFAVFAAIAIPTGLAIGFITPAFPTIGLASIPVMLGTILLFNALPEEILFRGLIQNSIESRLKSPAGGLLIGALIFGASHLNNGPVVPNYKYFFMATIAGVFYGRAWRNEKNVLTSTITHTLVNVFWRLFFR